MNVQAEARVSTFEPTLSRGTESLARRRPELGAPFEQRRSIMEAKAKERQRRRLVERVSCSGSLAGWPDDIGLVECYVLRCRNQLLQYACDGVLSPFFPISTLLDSPSSAVQFCSFATIYFLLACPQVI